MKKLRPHSVNTANDYDIHVTHRIEDSEVVIEFDVKTSMSHVSAEFCTEKLSNVGLWDFDVVEVFIQKKCEKNHYLELQVSPMNQKFALLVKEPRKDTTQVESLKSNITAKSTEFGFKAIFKIHASDIPGSSDEIYANFFACLGPKENRNYFALNINKEAEPDYHRPDLFEYIGSL
jgi:hypothetical protein